MQITTLFFCLEGFIGFTPIHSGWVLYYKANICFLLSLLYLLYVISLVTAYKILVNEVSLETVTNLIQSGLDITLQNHIITAWMLFRLVYNSLEMQ